VSAIYEIVSAFKKEILVYVTKG